jgi:hypothetical protein
MSGNNYKQCATACIMPVQGLAVLISRGAAADMTLCHASLAIAIATRSDAAAGTTSCQGSCTAACTQWVVLFNRASIKHVQGSAAPSVVNSNHQYHAV